MLDKLIELFNKNEFYNVIDQCEEILGKPENLDDTIAVNIYNILGLAHFNINDFDKSIEIFNKALSLNDKLWVIHNNLANTYRVKRNNELAFSSYDRAIKLDKEAGMPYFGKGLLCIANSDLETACDLFRTSIDKEPSFHENYTKLFKCLYDLNRIDEAKDILDKALSSCTPSDSFYRDLAKCYQDDQNFDLSLKYYKDALSINKNNNELYYDIAELHIRFNKYDEGIKYFESLINKNSSNPYLYFSICLFFNSLNDNESFFKYSELGMLIKDNDSNHLNQLGVAYYKLREIKKAEEFYKRAIESNPILWKSYYNIGNLYYSINETAKSIEALNKAYELNPEEGLVKFSYGRTLKLNTNYEKAIEFFTKSKVDGWEEFVLECLYLQRKYDDFAEFIDKNSDALSFSRTASALVSHANLHFKKKVKHTLCNNPLEYVKYFDLGDFDNKNNINKRLLKEIKEYDMGERRQPLLENGTQSIKNIFNQGSDLFKKLEITIYEKMDEYRKCFLESNDQFIKNWPEETDLTGWFISMSKSGYLKPHNHVNGWLSGVYYVQIPKKNNISDGNIQFCLNNLSYPSIDTDLPTLEIETLESRIVLFPSSLYHRSLPFTEETNRVCIAFDFQPKAQTIENTIEVL
tara:strand:+ start:212 stop:2116 length:1905 start_codon:yes stop_codon:yes gene_type:complete